jgi:hypothetical protein
MPILTLIALVLTLALLTQFQLKIYLVGFSFLFIAGAAFFFKEKFH